MSQQAQTGWFTFDLFEWTALVALAGPVLALGWFDAGRDARAQLASLAGAMIAAGAALARCWFRNRPFPGIPWLVGVVVAGVVLAAAQLIPLPESLARSLSPASAGFWAESARILPPDLIDVESPPRSEPIRSPITVYPRGTRGETTALGWLAIVSFAAALSLRKPKSMLVFLGAAGLNGAALAVMGVGLKLSRAAEGTNSSAFGTLANRNHASGYLNIALACLLGIAIWQWATRWSEERRQREREEEEAGFDPPGQDEGWIRKLVADASGPLPLVVLGVFVVVMGIVMAESRGGWATATATFAVALAIVSCHRPRRVWTLAIVGAALVAGGAGLIAWFGFEERLAARMDSLTVAATTFSDGRIDHWGDALRAASAYAPGGCGLGAYRFGYVPFDTGRGNLLFYHAENQYVETLACGGFLGLALLLTAIAVAGWNCLALCRRPTGDPAFLVGAGALLALVGQSLQANVDFGLYMPANAALFAVVLVGASAVALNAKATDGTHKQGKPRRNIGRGTAMWGVALVGALACCLELPSVEATRRACRETEVALRKQDPFPNALAQRLERIVKDHPDDVEAHMALAAAAVQRFRRNTAELLAPTLPNAREAEIWNRTDPLNWHRLANGYRRSARFDAWRSELHQAEFVVRDLPTAIDSLEACVRHCAVSPWATTQLVQLAPAAMPVTADWERRAAAVARARIGANARLWVELGCVEAELGDLDQAARDLSNAMRLGSGTIESALRASQLYPGLMESKDWKFPDDLPALASTMHEHLAAPSDRPLRDVLTSHLEDQIAKGTGSEADRAYAQASLHATANRMPESADAFRRAISLEPRNLTWRVEFVTVLKRLERTEEAQAVIFEGLRLFPRDRKLAELSRSLE